jgi:hypothetical protein
LIIADAQPTPRLTLIAPKAQLRLHAPHSTQLSRATRAAFGPFMANTPLGHTSVHRLQPVQASTEKASVTTPFK